MIDGIFRVELRNTFRIASIEERQPALDYCSRTPSPSHSYSRVEHTGRLRRRHCSARQAAPRMFSSNSMPPSAENVLGRLDRPPGPRRHRGGHHPHKSVVHDETLKQLAVPPVEHHHPTPTRTPRPRTDPPRPAPDDAHPPTHPRPNPHRPHHHRTPPQQRRTRPLRRQPNPRRHITKAGTNPDPEHQPCPYIFHPAGYIPDYGDDLPPF